MKIMQTQGHKSDMKMGNTMGTIPNNNIGLETDSTIERRAIGLFTYRRWKYILDRVFALLALVILSPLLAIIALGIKLDSRGSAIHSRTQVGEGEKTFTAYKFRTMYSNSDDREYKLYLAKYIQECAPYKIDHNGRAVYKLVEDSRVTRFGALLRKTNLDELPQLYNVLKGEMSWIGPRPDIPFAVSMYKDWHRQRLSVKPGITGLWQVSGRKGLSFDDMVRLDIDYIRRQSPVLDAKIVLFTVKTFLRGDGS